MAADIAPLPDAAIDAVLKLKQELESLPHTQRLTDADAEAVYALAYREYTQARYEEALRYFQVLLVYRPTHKVYLLGAALCLQRVRRYDLAIAAYGALSLLDPQQPSHTLALAECQLLCHEHAQARETLALVIDFCHDNPGHDPVRARAEAMLELMRSHNERHVESTPA
jgi:type III secretion system low calcium response chaperone LcrH/SycD